MDSSLSSNDTRFAQLAVEHKFISQEQAKLALDLYRRYHAQGGDIPSIPRILVQKGFLQRMLAEQLFKHLLLDEPMPENGSNDISLQPDEEEDPMSGYGATVFQGEIKGYKIIEVIGEGAMGTVYRAHQISMDRIVALKVYKAKNKDQSFVEQFLSEARNAGRLNHPNLIRVHEVGRSGEHYYYSMEYVDGLTLGELSDEFEGGRLDMKRGVNIFMQVAAALDHGLRLGIVHREIRPDAIMITEGDQAKLDGLGLTKDEDKRFLEGENAYYVSPEQAKGMPADTRSDIYTLGCCLYHALTGEPPFQGGGPKEVLGRRLLDPPTHPLDLNPDLPEELADVILKMLARDPKQRYQNPSEVIEALKSAQASLTAPQKPLPAKPQGKPGLKPGLKPGNKLRPRLGARPGAGGLNRGRNVRRFRR